MTINFKSPEIKELQPRLLVVGVGGAGGNALNEMIDSGLTRSRIHCREHRRARFKVKQS